MNAQKQWLKLWRMYREAYKYHAEIGMYNLRDMMKTRFRREAALERRIAALERENARLQELLNGVHFAIWQERL